MLKRYTIWSVMIDWALLLREHQHYYCKHEISNPCYCWAMVLTEHWVFFDAFPCRWAFSKAIVKYLSNNATAVFGSYEKSIKTSDLTRKLFYNLYIYRDKSLFFLMKCSSSSKAPRVVIYGGWSGDHQRIFQNKTYTQPEPNVSSHALLVLSRSIDM